MKNRIIKIISALCVVSIIYISSFCTAFAAEISFSTTEVSVQKGRLMNIEICAKSNTKVCAAYFEFTYDKSLFEFREVKKSDSSSMVEAYEVNDCVRVLFLNSNGCDINTEKPIFTLTLKAINGGKGSLDYTVSDVVDENLKHMEIGKCTSGMLTVTESSTAEKDKSSENSKSDSSSGKSEKATSITEKNDSSIRNIGNITINKNNNLASFFAGIFAMLALFAVVLIFVAIIRNKRKKKTEHENEKM